jgi:hypothetical protein
MIFVPYYLERRMCFGRKQERDVPKSRKGQRLVQPRRIQRIPPCAAAGTYRTSESSACAKTRAYAQTSARAYAQTSARADAKTGANAEARARAKARA